VSLVRKRALSTPSFEMTETLGSWNNYRIELDATGPLTDNGALRARADVVYATRDYFFDQAHLNRKKAFAALEYDFTPMAVLAGIPGAHVVDDDAGGYIVTSDGSEATAP
jgi:outer-membrane receptor for ferric coprogen and ferric-rhodotorulic acid